MFNKEARRLARVFARALAVESPVGTWTHGVDAGAIGAACTMATLRDMRVCYKAYSTRWGGIGIWHGAGTGAVSGAADMVSAVGLFNARQQVNAECGVRKVLRLRGCWLGRDGVAQTLRGGCLNEETSDHGACVLPIAHHDVCHNVCRDVRAHHACVVCVWTVERDRRPETRVPRGVENRTKT